MFIPPASIENKSSGLAVDIENKIYTNFIVTAYPAWSIQFLHRHNGTSLALKNLASGFTDNITS